MQSDDEGYSRGVAAAGVDAVAYLPIVGDGRILGLLSFGAPQSAGGPSALAAWFPILTEVAEVAGATLAPALIALETRSSATALIDDVIAGGRFHPVFQPIVELGSGRTVGYEALSRFDVSIGTAQLFAYAAAAGRLRQLELATLFAALDASTRLPRDRWLSLNTSPALLVDFGEVAARLRGIRRPIVLEISEHDAIADYAPIAAAIERLGPRRSLAVDDAGAGFASLRHILEVKPAYVKLDIGLVEGVSSDLSRRALVAGMVHFARDAGFTLIAEGIETNEDLVVLRALGVGLGQGYLLGRPAELRELLAKRAA